MGLTDYSDMEQEITDAPVPKVLKAGEEVEARITTVRSGTSDKNEATWFTPVFDVPSDPMVMEFNDFFWDLADRDKLTEKDFQRSLDKFRNFAQAFGIDYARPFDWEDDLPGLTGWLIVGVRKSDDYGNQNTVRKYVVKK